MVGRAPVVVGVLRDVVRAMPSNAAAWRELGAALAEANQLHESLSCFEQSTKLRPDVADGWADLAVAFRLAGRPEDAVRAWQKVLELVPGDEFAAATLGYTLIERDDWSEAMAVFAPFRESTSNPALARGYALCLQATGAVEHAEDEYRRLSRRFPERSDIWISLGECLNKRGRHQEAFEACETALRLKVTAPMAWSNLGDALEGLGQMQYACDCWRRAVEIDPGASHAASRLRLRSVAPRTRE